MSWRTLPAFHEPAGCVHGEGSDLDISVSLVGPARGRRKTLKADDIAGCVFYCLTQPQRCDILTVQICPNTQAIC